MHIPKIPTPLNLLSFAIFGITLSFRILPICLNPLLTDAVGLEAVLPHPTHFDLETAPLDSLPARPWVET
jgi:hypothetical protein